MKSGRVRRVRVTIDRGTPDLDVPGQLPAQILELAEQVQAHHDRMAQRTANNGTGLVPRHVAKRHNDSLLSDQVRNMICNRWEPHRYPGGGAHHETRCARIHSFECPVGSVLIPRRSGRPRGLRGRGGPRRAPYRHSRVSSFSRRQHCLLQAGVACSVRKAFAHDPR